MATLHLISHTHWDREWYLTFQQFRLKLVNLVDNLLALMQADSQFKYFMLDGQTIVLDDYLQMRPERELEIRKLVQEGRLLIGPWHILPDEFLVSPEATIRNLLQGERTAQRFGSKMMVGYTPDPFGHIGQLPQILRGFNINTACVQRGPSEEPCEFFWQSPDGSSVLMAYLRDGYGNAYLLPTSRPDDFVAEVKRLRDSLLPYSAASQLLLMLGTDHMQPPHDTSMAIDYAKHHLEEDTLLHSSLSEALVAIQDQITRLDLSLPTVTGELRSSKRHFLLPGVLSSRIWIKQRNDACQTLLEKWAEPFSTFAGLIRTEDRPIKGRLYHPAPLIRQAWRLLMECHPHDSICGCSIDQVHEEMRPRFDQVEQIGEELTNQSLEAIVAEIDTRLTANHPPLAIVVFNPLGYMRTDTVDVTIPFLKGMQSFEILDEAGQFIPYHLEGAFSREIAYLVVDRDNVLSQLSVAEQGRVMGMSIQEVRFERAGNTLKIDATLSDLGDPNVEAIAQAFQSIPEIMEDPELDRFVLKAEVIGFQVHLVAQDVPGLGYKTFWLRPAAQSHSQPEAEPEPEEIENEFLAVRVSPLDGTLTLTDKRSGVEYQGLNRFVDGGDCGDEYNYCPPAQDRLITAEVQSIKFECNPAEKSIVISQLITVPVGLAPDRQKRSLENADMLLVTRASLAPGVPRLDIHTDVENPARDHRLRVHFPAPISVDSADYDGHFEVVRRPLGAPAFDASWAEQPRPEQPQRAFTAISNSQAGLMIANRGLPEVEILRTPEGDSEIALTLLRCVGWLSRGDFATRRGHAGPGLPTPGAQMLGQWSFAYAVIPFVGEWEAAYQEAYAFHTPLRALATGIHAGQLPGVRSFIQATPRTFMISAIKAAEDGSGWILRGYNITGEPIHVKIKTWKPFPDTYRVNLAEEILEKIAPQPDSSLSFELRGHEIATIKLS